MKILSSKVGNLSKLVIACVLLLGIASLFIFLQTKKSKEVKEEVKNTVGVSSQADDTELLELEISKADHQKLSTKKWNAFEYGILFATDDDYVPTNIKYKGEEYPAEIRLKGDWLQHVKKETWSFRVKMKDNYTLDGMLKFSLQHPQTEKLCRRMAFSRTTRIRRYFKPTIQICKRQS